MYDATEPDTIPADVPAPGYTMGYVDGKWPSYEAMRARYPTAVPVALSAIPDSATAATAQGCDGESGDYSPAQAAAFAHAKLTDGVVPFTYCSWANWHDYQLACTDIGVNPNDVDWGIAAYPGIGAVLYPGTVFHQFIDHGPYDQSVVALGWLPGRPVVVISSQPTQEAQMPVSEAVTFKPGQIDVFQVSFGTLWHKWLTAEGWQNEVLTGPFSVIPVTRDTTLAEQSPAVAVIGGQCIVTVEDVSERVWYLAQSSDSVQWGVNELP